MYSSVWQKNKLVPVRIAGQLLKQSEFKGDKKTALIYKSSLVRLNKDILLRDGSIYISLSDANMLEKKPDASLLSDLEQSGITINSTLYISIESFAGILGLSCVYDSITNTLYMS